MTLRELAARLECQLEGDGAIEVHHVATLEQAGPGALSFLANPKYTSALTTTRASAAIVGLDAPKAPCALLRTRNPYLAFARAVQALAPPPVRPSGIHPTAIVSTAAALGEGVAIGPYCVVGDGARIGAGTVLHSHVYVEAGAIVGPGCELHPRVSIHAGCTLGARVVVKDGAVIGSWGFGFATRDDGTHEAIPQIGPLVLEDDVQVGANTCIDRPAVGETRVKAGTKIDNLVQIAHGVTVGTNSFLAAQVGIAGSTIVGNSVMMGGQVGVTGHVTVGDRAVMSAKTGITGHVPEGAFMSGYPSMDNLEWRKAHAVVRNLPDLRKRVMELERRLAELEQRKDGDKEAVDAQA